MIRTSPIREALDRLDILDDGKRRLRRVDEDLKGYFKNHYMNAFGEIPQVGPAEARKKSEADAYAKALEVARLDPTFKGGEGMSPEEALNKPQGSYFDWLMRLIKKGVETYDGMMAHKDAYKDQLAHFDAYKSRGKIPADKRDIMRMKKLEDVVELINSLGGDIDVSSAESANTFKDAIKNIRGALQTICGFTNEEIPEDIQSASDCLELVCENSDWELWEIKNIWGAMLADTYGYTWGGGATWCTGGQYQAGSNPRQGAELKASAERHYGYYTSGNKVLYFFQNKDNSIPRPKNKAQFTLVDGYEVRDFFHANDSSLGLDADGNISYTSFRGDPSEVMAVWLNTTGMLGPVKASKLKNIEPIIDAENLERLRNGEPYRYAGGAIKSSMAGSIKKIIFEHDGKTYEVDATKTPLLLQATTVEEMFNIMELSNGKPYTYNGERIPRLLKDAIKEVVFAENYAVTREEARLEHLNLPEDFDGYCLRSNAFYGCSSLEKVHLPANVTAIGMYCFDNTTDNIQVLTPREPDRTLYTYSTEAEKLQRLLRYVDGGEVA